VLANHRTQVVGKAFRTTHEYANFVQLTFRESLRDIETCLGAVGGKLYHMGFHTSVARSTLADANESRDWRIYADFAQTLIATARRLYAGDAMGVDQDQSLYALDSTTIDLCLALFPVLIPFGEWRTSGRQAGLPKIPASFGERFKITNEARWTRLGSANQTWWMANLLGLVTRPPCVRPEERTWTSFCAASSESSCVGACPQDTNSSGFCARQIIQWWRLPLRKGSA
jgi:hypothetical protein